MFVKRPMNEVTHAMVRVASFSCMDWFGIPFLLDTLYSDLQGLMDFYFQKRMFKTLSYYQFLHGQQLHKISHLLSIT